MADTDELIELLFFDTFSHEIHEDLNLDLVQFPQPVYIADVRIIPLGARVQADFPGGVRLGATNPSKFHIEFFVNDLSKPGASTFERLGDFEYNQNDCINLQCTPSIERGERRIPTDGIVLRGWYTTITLAVYGTVAKDGIGAPQISSPQPPMVNIEPMDDSLLTQENPTVETKQDASFDLDWKKHDEREPKEPLQFAKNLYAVDLAQQSPNLRDTARQYTENWIASNEANKGNTLVRGKSSDVENWDNDDDLNKSISSPRSTRRSRSPTDSRRGSIKTDWSKSPEYRRRSYERGVLDKKLMKTRELESLRRSPTLRMPRTPSPESIQSPASRRPRTPSDEFALKTKFQAKSPLSTNDENEMPANLSGPTGSVPSEPEDDAMSQGEAFEPILSDEEIGDDSFDQYESDYNETEDVNPVNSLYHFNPFVEPLNSYVPDDQKMSSNAKELIELASKCLHRSKLKEHNDIEKSFIDNTSIEMKENWVQATEQLNQIINLIYNLAGATRSRSQKALSTLIQQNQQELINWMKIGLNFDCANSQHQPGYKIRHIKCGVRLIELIAVDENFMKNLFEMEKINVFDYLFCLYEQKFMALSIKLMICRAFYSCLDTKIGIKYFTKIIDVKSVDDKNFTIEQQQLNGYQKIIEMLRTNPLTRIKFALKSIVKKVNLYEALQTIRETLNNRIILNDKIKCDLESYEIDQNVLKCCLNETWSAFTWDIQNLSQPKRFLPISTKFEKVIDTNASKAAINSLINYFHIHGLLESLLMIIANHLHPSIGDEVFDVTLLILESLCRTSIGLEYLSEHIETTNALAKCLLRAHYIDGNDVEIMENPPQLNELNDIDENTRIHRLGIEISYKMKTYYYLNAIADINIDTVNREELLIEYFHDLYSMAVANGFVGRKHIIELLTMNDNILIVLKQIEIERKTINIAIANIANDNELSYEKGPILNYAIDLIDMTVRNANTNIDYLHRHGQILLNLVKSYESFESSITQVLQDLLLYLKPLESVNIFSHDNCGTLCETIKRNLEFITTFPGDVITSLRIAKHLAIPDTRIFDIGTDFADIYSDATAINVLASNKKQSKFEQHQVELKYKFAILQLYSTDGISTCVSIMDKLATYFAQPAVHTATLTTNQGILAIQVLLPTIELLRKMLTYVIESRNTEFKDVTAIEPMLRTFTLLNYISPQALAYDDAQQIQSEIVKTLMAYTLPTPAAGVDTESVHKSLWTQMIAEVLKYIISGPSTFVPGLNLLSQLLPVPLPMLTKRPLTINEQARIVTERQMWSAHLHPKSIEISEMIQSLCVSSYPQLMDLLVRIIGQLADLAPNMALLTVKAVVDIALLDGSSSIQGTELTANGTILPSQTVNTVSNGNANATSIAPTAAQIALISVYVNPQTKRVLNFLSNIIRQPPIKAAFMSIMPGKCFELFSKILSVKSASIPNTLWTVLNQEQESILAIILVMLNTEISLISADTHNIDKDLILASSLPPRECLPGIIGAILDHFFIVDDVINSFGSQITALKALMILTEYDYTMYQLRSMLLKRKDSLLSKLRILSRPSDDDANSFEMISTLLLLLQSLNRPNVTRSFTCTEIDLVKILQFKRLPIDHESDTDAVIHPLLVLDNHFASLLIKTETTDATKAQFEEATRNLKNIIQILDDGLAAIATNVSKEILVDSPAGEPPFPQSEGLVTQFSMRTLFTIVSQNCNGTDVFEQFTTNYWYSKSIPNRFDDIAANDIHVPITDSVSCDLNEMIKTCLPSDWNLLLDCKRLLHLSASPQSTRERTTSAPCFRTRRVEVEPSTGRPEKKIYISRGRGFSRAAANRADLFRSRPPNTSRPPSLHVDDFLALETCGAQPTGPTGYNKLAREIISIRGSRGGRGRGRIGLSSGPGAYRHSIRRNNSPSTWGPHGGGPNLGDGNSSSTPHFRTATAEPVHSSHFPPSHYGGPPIRGRRGGIRPPRSFNKFN